MTELEKSLERKDHEHRQSYCHQLMAASADLLDDIRSRPGEMPEDLSHDARVDWAGYVEACDRDYANHKATLLTAVTALETLGTRKVVDAGRAFADELEGDTTEDKLRAAREHLVDAVRADVAPD